MENSYYFVTMIESTSSSCASRVKFHDFGFKYFAKQDVEGGTQRIRMSHCELNKDMLNLKKKRVNIFELFTFFKEKGCVNMSTCV